MKNACLVLVALFLCSNALPAADWRPIDPAELAQKTPRVEPGADAEAIFWDVKIEDRVTGEDVSYAMIHYVRIKIFTDLGREKYATVEIPRIGKIYINDVAGRTIKADGTTIDLKKDAIFDRQLVKTKGTKLRGTTFTLPNVTAGDIIEYRYREIHDNELANRLRLYFQRELPIWQVSYHLKPLNIPWFPYAMRTMVFQCQPPPFKREPDGFYTTSMTNSAAFHEEPYMPPADNLRAWMLIYYEEDKKVDAPKFWKETGKSDFASSKPFIKVDNLVKQTVAEVTSGTEKDADKLAAIDRFCRTKIRNINNSANPATSAELKAMKENRSPGDTLKQKAGTSRDVDRLFAAMAIAAGFDARMARVADRSDFFFHPGRPTTTFLNTYDVAVKTGEKWTFFDPATPYLEAGMLRWQEENTAALVSDPKEGTLVMTQYSPAERSKRVRHGEFKLLDDGTLEGSVKYTYTGHSSRRQKTYYEDMTPARQEEDWKDSMKERLSTAEISNFAIENLTDPEKPVVVRHDIKVPGYATRTGKRILLQPAFFQRNVTPRFTESTRKWDLYFEHGWSEEDDITIDLPEGWELDQPVAPKSTPFDVVGQYSVEVRKTPDGRKLIYHRIFDWGRENRVIFPVEAYPNLKAAFDFVQQQDGYTIALRAAANAK